MDSYEQLVCATCGEERAPRPSHPAPQHAVPCRCGSRRFRIRAVVCLEEDELDHLIELTEFSGRSSVLHEIVLDRLYTGRRFDLAVDVAELDTILEEAV